MITTVCITCQHLIRLDINNTQMWVDDDGSSRCAEFGGHKPPPRFLVIALVMDEMTVVDAEIGESVTSLDYIDGIGREFAKQTNERAAHELAQTITAPLNKHTHPDEMNYMNAHVFGEEQQ